MIQQFHFSVYMQRKRKQDTEKISALPRSLQHYLQLPRYGNNLFASG